MCKTETCSCDIEYKVRIFLDDGAVLPERQTELSAGYDVSANEDIIINPGDTKMVKTGIYVELPPNLEMQIRPRSGLALKNGIQVANAPGTLDADYRGELKIILFNTSPSPFPVSKGMRIAQIVYNEFIVVKYDGVETKEELSKTERGEGGFGSSGV